jgi:hypothetical protein
MFSTLLKMLPRDESIEDKFKDLWAQWYGDFVSSSMSFD